MLKRKLLAVALPVLSAVTIVGSGFAAWNFQEISNAEQTKSIGFLITDITEGLGAFSYKVDDEVTEDVADLGLSLVLDQGGNYTNISDDDYEDYGIDVRKVVLGQTVEGYTPISNLNISFSVSELDMIKYINSNFELVISVNISLTGGLTDYVEYTEDIKIDGEQRDENKITYNTKSSVDCSIDINLRSSQFKYKQGKKPTTKSEYDDMNNVALINSNFNISVKAELK